MQPKLHITHIITGLGNGGAENVLFHLVKNSNLQINHHVISLTSRGKYYNSLIANNIQVSVIGMPRGKLTISGIFKLINLLIKTDTNIVQTWMYHGDLIGGICAKLARKKNILWNLRSAELSKKDMKVSTKFVIKISAILSRWIPDKIISCSLRSIEVHEGIGYQNKFHHIPNGYDDSIFYSSLNQRSEIRKAWGYSTQKQILFGMVARFDPQKDHETLLQAFSLARKKINNIKLILVGKEINQDNIFLTSMINDLKINDSVKLLSESNNVAAVMNGIDAHVLSSSYGEGFPNAVLESMACGTPSIVTNVGDAAYIVNNKELVVSPNNPEELADVIISIAILINNNSKLYHDYCISSLTRAESEFSLNKMIQGYELLWNRYL